MEEWKKYTVQELIEKGMIEAPMDGNHGGKHPKSSDYVKSGVPFIMANDLVGGSIDYDNCSFISEEQAHTLVKGFAKPGDVLLTHKATIGRTALVPNKFETIVLTPQVTYYRVIKGIDNKYLKYYFDTPDFQSLFCNWASSGSTRAYLGITAQHKLPIVLPNIETQVNISSILSSLDDKIAVNKKICENLEAQAQALFKHWFVDFAPFKDGKFVENKLGLIPEGWRVVTLGDIAELRKPSIKPQDNILYTHYSIPAFDNGMKPSIDEGSTIKSNKFGINDAAILLSKLNPSTKRIWYTGNVSENSVSSTEFLPFYSKNKELTPFVYCYLNCDRNYREIANGAKGTTNSHQRIDANSILTRGLAYSEEAIKKFCDCSQYLMELILEANQESSRLATLRDALLPKLMSGEISLE